MMSICAKQNFSSIYRRFSSAEAATEAITQIQNENDCHISHLTEQLKAIEEAIQSYQSENK